MIIKLKQKSRHRTIYSSLCFIKLVGHKNDSYHNKRYGKIVSPTRNRHRNTQGKRQLYIIRVYVYLCFIVRVYTHNPMLFFH